MVSRISFGVLFFISVGLAFGQQDSVLLEELEIQANHFQRFATGNSRRLKVRDESEDLEQVLTGENSVYFRTYGNQQLASISFRGTSSSHTSVLWHGIPANYPTLGQLDFSQWPAWLMESVDLQPGSNGALYGSGAIGGTVLIDSDQLIAGEPSASALASIGSFGYHFIGAKGSYGQSKVRAETRLFQSFLRNNFSYEFDGKPYTQENAAVLNYGVQQKLQIDLENNVRLFLDGQFTKNDREIQPPKLNPDAGDELNTENVRIAAGIQRERIDASFSATFGFLRNNQVYNRLDQTVSNQYSLLLANWHAIKPKIELRYGANVNTFTAASDYYPDTFTDWRSALFTSVKYLPKPWWSTILNLRQSFYQGRNPFTPSWSNEFYLKRSSQVVVTLDQKVSIGFRYPSLNDLYWRPGGNPDLIPERSVQGEASLDWTVNRVNFRSTLDAGIYRTWSSNWIVWLPNESGIWSPRNFREVIVNGIELSQRLQGSFWSQTDMIRVNYSISQSINQTGENAGNLMPYTPMQTASIYLESTFKGDVVPYLSGDFTDRRFTTLDNTIIQSVNPYFLLDFGMSKKLKWSLLSLKVSVEVKNVLDTDYENLINRAMPGRNYQFNLLIKFK